MSDVLGHEPGRLPRAVPVVAGVGLVAAVLVLGARSALPTPRRPVATASPSTSPSPAAPELPRASTAPDACGSDVTLPIYAAHPQLAPTGLRLLVGDRDLRLVDVDRGTTRTLSRRVGGQTITQLRQDGDSILGVRAGTCSTSRIGDGQVGLVDPVTGRFTSRGRGDDLLPGSPATALQMSEQGRTHLWAVGSAATTQVPEPWFPLARTGSSYVVAAGGGPDTAPTLGIGAPSTGRLTRRVGIGDAVAATDSAVLWVRGRCADGPCQLTATTFDGSSSTRTIPGPAWGGVFSPEGRYVAFRQVRSSGQLGNHPGPPNDVAVLHVRTGELRVLPDLVLPAKAPLTLAWSPDGQWLVLGADLGRRPLILLWQRWSAQLAEVPVPAGGTTGAPAVVVLPAQSR